MSSALKTKLRSYLQEWEALDLHYRRLKESAQDLDLESRQNLNDLYEFDQLCYEYNAIKTYYHVSKSQWNSSDRKPLEEFAELMPKVEAKLELDDLYARHNGLKVLRRNLSLSAESGGKIAHALMISSTDLLGMRLVVEEMRGEANEDLAQNAAGSLQEWATIKTSTKKKTPVPKKAVVSKSVSENGADKQKVKSASFVPPPMPSSGSFEAGKIHVITNIGSALSSSQQREKETSDLKLATNASTSANASAAYGGSDSGTTDQAADLAADVADDVADENAGVDFDDVDPDMEVESGDSQSAPGEVSAIEHSQISSKRQSLADSEPVTKKPKISPIIEVNVVQSNSSQSSDVESRHNGKEVLTKAGEKVSVLSKPSLPTTSHAPPSTPRDSAFHGSNASLFPTSVHQASANSVPSQNVPNTTASGLKNDHIQTNTSLGTTKKAGSDVKPKERSSFAQFSTWSKDHVRCVVNAAQESPDAPEFAIQAALYARFSVMITFDEARTLCMHYGLSHRTMGNYGFYIQTFRSVASQIKDRKAQYVTVPWSEIQTQYFRLTRISLNEAELKSRYHLFLLHRRVFGSNGEPSSNYQEEVEAFRKKYARRAQNVSRDTSFDSSAKGQNISLHDFSTIPTKLPSGSAVRDITSKNSDNVPRGAHSDKPAQHLDTENHVTSHGSQSSSSLPAATEKGPAQSQNTIHGLKEYAASLSSLPESRMSQKPLQTPLTPHANTSVVPVAGHDKTNGTKSGLSITGGLISQLSPTTQNPSIRNIKTPAPNPAQGQAPRLDQSGSEDASLWTPTVFKALVDAYCSIKPNVPNRAQAIAQYIRLKTGVVVRLDQILEMAKTDRFLAALKKSNPNGLEDYAAQLKEFTEQLGGSLTLSERIQAISDKMKSEEKPDDYYREKLKRMYTTKQWDLSMSKCVISSIEFADRIPPESKSTNAKLIRSQILLFIKFRLLREHSVKITHSAISTRLQRMMSMNVFSEPQCRLINSALESS